MKKVSLLILVSLILLLSFASCTLLDQLLGKAPAECEHEWTEATCTAPKTCTKCNATEGEAAAHNWADATCTAPKTCKTCNKTEGAPNGHTEVTLEAVAPTCTSTGLTEGKKCSVCNTVTKEQTTVAKLAHTEVDVPGTAATCTSEGLSDGKQCSVCQTWTVPQEVVPAHGHTLETLPGKAATCTEAGLSDGKKCTVCQTVTVEQEPIDALGHNSDTVVPGKEATCTEPGLTDGAKCSRCQTVTVEQEPIPAPGHDTDGAEAVKENYTPATCMADGGYDMVTRCWECNEVVSSEHFVEPKVAHDFQNYKHDEGSEKCGVDGTKTGTCSYSCGTTDTVTDPGTALEHKKPDNALCGETWTCVHGCGYSAVLEHTPGEPTTETVTAPTCTEPGAGVKKTACTECNTVLTEETVEIAALGHDKVDATCSAPITCSRCDYTEGAPRANHNVKAVYADGTLKYVCASGCDIEFVVDTKYYYDGSDTSFFYQSNGTMPVDTSNGFYEYVFTPDTLDAPTEADFLAIDNNNDLSDGCKDGSGYIKGWAYNHSSKKIGAQPMFWFPGQNDGDLDFKDFSTEKNAVGVASFKMKSSMTDAFTVAIAKPRSAADWGKWDNSSINILNIGGAAGQNAITIQGGLNGSDKVFTTIPVGEDGWSEWFEVKVFFQLLDNGYLNVAFYVNDVFGGSFARDLQNPNGKYTLDSLNIRALYINGWTYAPNTGIAIDDVAFGYTTEADYIFDECDHDNKVEVKAPTCLEGGYTTNTCSKCGLVKITDKTDALGHALATAEAKDSTCLEKGWDEHQYCTRCDYTEKVEKDLANCVGGEPVREKVVNAECEKPGSYEEVVYCSVCGKELSRETKVIPALEHDSDTVVPGTEATCTAPGLTDGAKCSKCGKEMTAQTEIPAKGHTIVADPAVEATCKTDGKTAGEHCSACDYKVEGTVVSKDTVPHTYDNDEDAECNVCGHTREVACQHTNKEPIAAVDATCTTPGSTAGEKCADCGEILTAPTTVTATGHTEVADAAVEATCTTAGKTAGKHCSVCDEVLVAQTEIPAKGHTETTLNAVEPTCTETGLTAGKHCTVCNTDTVPQTVVAALGHNWSAATCDAPKTCQRCGETEGEALANHTLTHKVADGKMVYSCATCAKTFTTETQTFYTDGSALNGFTFNDGKTNASYAGTTNAPAQKEADGNKYYEFLRDTEYNTTVDGNKASGQAIMWIPAYHDGLTDLNGANNSVAFFTMDINYAMSSHLTFNIVYGNGPVEYFTAEEAAAKGNPALEGTKKAWYETPLGKIMDAVLHFQTQKDANGNPNGVQVVGWNNAVLATYDFQSDATFTAYGATDWFKVAFALELDNASDMLVAHYYVNGAYVTTQCHENTLENNVIKSVQLDGTSTPINSGYQFDNLGFGYTNGVAYNFDTCAHQYGEATTVAPTCDVKGYDAHTCELCGYVEHFNFVDATGHNASAATCTEPSVCTKCGETLAPATGHSYSAPSCVAVETCTVCGATKGQTNPNAHNLEATYSGGKLFYVCQICDHRFDVDTFVYHDGSNASLPGSNYVGGNSKYNDGTNKYASNGDYVYAITDINATVNTDSQMQLWVPGIKNGEGTFQGFSLTNSAVGALSFKTKLSLTNAADIFTLKLVESGWGAAGCIDTNLLQFTPFFSDEAKTQLAGIRFSGYSANADDGYVIKLADFSVDADGWTDWIDIKVLLVMNSDTGNLDAHYYIGGEYVHSGSKKVTTTNKSVCSVYGNLNAWNEGTGVMLDDIAFGYTAHKHDLTPAEKDGALVYTCECGTTFNVTNYLGWNGDGSDSAYKNVPNGNVPLNVVDGKYEYIFKPETDVAPDFSDPAGSQSANGWFEYDKSTYAGGQLQMWMPSNNRGESTFDGFSCENNAVGIISFSMKTNMARHPKWDTSLTFSVGKPRNASDWNDGGSWTDDSINIFTVEEYQASGVVIKGGNNGTGMVLSTIPAAGDGWSEWFDVQIVIALSSDGIMNTYYYVNGTYCGMYSRNLTAKGEDGRYLNPQKIEALQISGWTYTPNTGIVFDDFYFGYEVGGHNTLDGQLHKLPANVTCAAPVTCSCGWTGIAVTHTFVSDCAPNCSACGANNPNATAHANLVPTVAGDDVVYACSTCNYGYTLKGGNMLTLADAVDATTAGVYTKTYTGTSLTMINNGTDTNAQYQFWFPGQSESPELAGFTNANGAVGFLSFKINAKDHHNTGVEFKVNANRGTGDWGGPSNNGWSESSVRIFHIKPTAEGATTVGLTGYNGADLGSIAITGTDGWTGWMDVVIMIQLNKDNTITLDYYVNGTLIKTIHADFVIWTHEINSLYLSGRTNGEGQGYELKDLCLGYAVDGATEIKPPFYKSEIAAEDVQSEALKTIVASKIKQLDQANANADPVANGDYFVEGGTPVYVLADGKDGSEVEALYFSRSVEWLGGSQNSKWSEFRFDTDKTQLMTGFSFDYLVVGTTDVSTEESDDGIGALGTSYVQLKNAAGTYLDQANSALTVDGEWHTMTITFAEAQNIANILVKLYRFQGEMLIANVNVVYENPLYNADGSLKVTEIGTRNATEDNTANVTDAALLTIVDAKLKQLDQTDAASEGDHSYGYFVKEGGTSRYVTLVGKDGETVQGVYVSRSVDWDTYADVAKADNAQNYFKSEFRFSLDKTKTIKSISFDYIINGSVTPNRRDSDQKDDLAIFQVREGSSGSYFDLFTDKGGESESDEDDDDVYVMDGQWHTFTYEWKEGDPTNLDLFLIILSEFQGEMVMSNIVVEYQS